MVVKDAGMVWFQLREYVALGSWLNGSSLVGRSPHSDIVSCYNLYISSMATFMSLGVCLRLFEQAGDMRPEQEETRHSYSTEVTAVKPAAVHAPPKRNKGEEQESRPEALEDAY